MRQRNQRIEAAARPRKNERQKRGVCGHLEGIADQIAAVVAELRPGMARLQSLMESSGFPDLISFADLNLARIFRTIFSLGWALSQRATRKLD